jgi:hypothetical protein
LPAGVFGLRNVFKIRLEILMTSFFIGFDGNSQNIIFIGFAGASHNKIALSQSYTFKKLC